MKSETRREELIQLLPGPIVVTGAGGFIGSNLFIELASSRSDVVGVVRKSVNPRIPASLARLTVPQDLSDRAGLLQLFSDLKPATVFHLATYGAYPSQSSPEKIFTNTLMASLNITEACLSTSVSSLVNAGSSSEYGENCAGPFEYGPRMPDSIYSVAKGAVGDMLRVMSHRNDGFSSANLRLYSVYGPLEDASRLIPTLLRFARQRKFPPLGPEWITRDFVFVKDAIEAFYRAALLCRENPGAHTFNIGSGVSTSLSGLANIIAQEFDVHETPHFGDFPPRSWDHPKWYSNSQKARDELGWQSQTSLVDGLRLTMNWLEKVPDGFLEAIDVTQDRS